MSNVFDNLDQVKFTPFSENVKNEKPERKSLSDNTTMLGIPFLDQVFRGLMPTDILLVGARTGGGKTTLVSNMALNIARQGKRVSLYSLESREFEIEQRLKYGKLCQKYYADLNRSHSKLRFVDWLTGQLDPVLSKYEDEVDKELSEIKNFNIFYRKSIKFDLAAFEKSFVAMDSETDVFIIDHLHYFDTDGTNENKEFTEITKKIRDLALVHKKSIILVAHIRKKVNNFDKMVIPSIDDFHGSSNITKIATKVLTIAPYPEGDIKDKNAYATLMQIAKFRDDGPATRYTGMLWLNGRTGDYSSNFKVGHMKGGTEFVAEEDESKIPYYMRSPMENL